VVNLRRGSGGVRVPDRKDLASHAHIEEAGIPAELTLFLSQHTGAPSKALVSVGDMVKRGQKIAEAGGPVSAALHAPTSGKVKAVEARYQPVLARMVDAIVLEPDGANEMVPGLGPVAADLEGVSREKIVEIAREAGMVGQGGAAFPVSVKLTPPPTAKIDTYLLNGAECEPYLTANNPFAYDACVQQQQTNPVGADPIGRLTSGGPFIRIPPRETLTSNMGFHITPKWTATWGTIYDFQEQRFASHSVTLQRELHDWRSIFAFTYAGVCRRTRSPASGSRESPCDS
jgi:hypothetical protein